MKSFGLPFISSQAGTTLCTADAEPPPMVNPFMSSRVFMLCRLLSKQIPAGQRVFNAPTSRMLPPLVRFNIKLRSEEHTSELQSLMRSSHAVFCLKKKKKQYKSNQQV